MDISNEMLIDVGFNALGSVLAGIMLFVIYSMFTRRNKVSHSGQKLAVTENSPESLIQSKSSENGKIEFVDFRSRISAAPKTLANEESLAGPANRFQRNRLEIIKQAQEMLAAGKPSHVIRQKLPMAEAGWQMNEKGQRIRSVRGAVND